MHQDHSEKVQRNVCCHNDADNLMLKVAIVEQNAKLR